MSSFALRVKRPTRHSGADKAKIVLGVLVTLLFLLPVIWMFVMSFRHQRDIFALPPLLFAEFTLDNYLLYLRQGDIQRRLINTVIVALGAGTVSIATGAMAGYAMARFKIKSVLVAGGLILASRGVPPIALGVPMYLVARRLDLLDQHVTLIIAYCTFTIPYVMWLSRSFFISVPKELEEAAMLDGLSRFGAFLRIIVPTSLPSLISTFIFVLILAWEELLFALILTNRNAATIPVAIAGMAADTEQGALWGPITAVGTITVVPIMIFALLVQKWLIRGISDGAIKG